MYWRTEGLEKGKDRVQPLSKERGREHVTKVGGLEGAWDILIASISNCCLGFLSSLLEAKLKRTQGLYIT